MHHNKNIFIKCMSLSMLKHSHDHDLKKRTLHLIVSRIYMEHETLQNIVIAEELHLNISADSKLKVHDTILEIQSKAPVPCCSVGPLSVPESQYRPHTLVPKAYMKGVRVASRVPSISLRMVLLSMAPATNSALDSLPSLLVSALAIM